MNLIKYIASLACTFAIPAVAQSAATSGETAQLFETIAQQDEKMLAAFNAHDVNGLMSMFSDDVEFYHDKGGSRIISRRDKDL